MSDPRRNLNTGYENLQWNNYYPAQPSSQQTYQNHQRREMQEACSQQLHLSTPSSPERHLAALPDSFIASSTPQCRCHVQLHQYQLSPCTPSSSLLSFSDSSTSQLSEEDSHAAATASPRTTQILADDRRRLRLMQREESRLEQLVTSLDSRLRIANAPASLGGASKNTELLTLQRMSAQSFLRTVQLYVSAKSEQVAAAAPADSAHPLASRGGCGSVLWSGSDSSGSDDCSLLDS